jgi:hypothetical protein
MHLPQTFNEVSDASSYIIFPLRKPRSSGEASKASWGRITAKFVASYARAEGAALKRGFTRVFLDGRPRSENGCR